MPKNIRRPILLSLLPLTMAGIWQLLAIYINKPTVLPGLDSVAYVLIHPATKIFMTGSLIQNMIISLIRVMLGVSLAALIAIPLGLGMGYFRLVEEFFDSFMEMLRPIPPLAWVPLILAWFGIQGISNWIPFFSDSALFSSIQFSTITIIFIGAFFPILVNTIQGVKCIPKEYIESARTLGAKRFFLVFKVIIPASFPSIVTGLRIGLGIGWMCLVAAEMMPGSNSGLGYLVWYAYELLRADIIVAGMMLVGFIGFIMDCGFRQIEKSLLWGNKL